MIVGPNSRGFLLTKGEDEIRKNFIYNTFVVLKYFTLQFFTSWEMNCLLLVVVYGYSFVTKII